MGYQDGSRLFVTIRDQVSSAACVSLGLGCVEFGSVLLLFVRRRDISPGLSLARE